MRRVIVISATVAAAALGWAWWEATKPIQWTGGWNQ